MRILLEELNDAIQKLGSGVSIDGISPDIFKILPNNMRQLIAHLMTAIFNSTYPESWRSQLLLPFPKKGHTITDPKLRGIGIGPGLSRIYDIMINQKFCNWYVPNPEQAGYREHQGGLLHIFSIYLLLDHAAMNNIEPYILFMDYEKAFDFVNRALLLEKLMNKGAGNKFVKALYESYTYTYYKPKISDKYTGAAIETDSGVTQGKTSSANLFSFYVSDMVSTTAIPTNDSDIFQLADDTAILCNNLQSLINRFRLLLKYSKDNYLLANMDKTKYLQLTRNASIPTPITIEENLVVKPSKDGYRYLGIKIIRSNSVYEQIMSNINERKGNIIKFNHWVDNHKYAPFNIKLQVLYACFLPSIFYGAEAWWILDQLKPTILEIERDALKICMGVRKTITTDLIYLEMNRPDYASYIQDQQYNFYHKIKNLSEEESIIKTIMNRCSTTNMMSYYENLLNNNNKKLNIDERLNRVKTNTSTMTKRYMDISNGKYASHIYDFNLCEEYRTLLTRWRLSCHDLEIETGRYKNIPRELRLCSLCLTVEDEHHVFFNCPRYSLARAKCPELMNDKKISDILHPSTTEAAKKAGKLIKDIESIRK